MPCLKVFGWTRITFLRNIYFCVSPLIKLVLRDENESVFIFSVFKRQSILGITQFGPRGSLTRVRITSTFSVLRPFSYLRPFMYFDPPTLLRSKLFVKLYFDLYFSSNKKSRSKKGRSRAVEVHFMKMVEVQKRSNWPVPVRHTSG